MGMTEGKSSKWKRYIFQAFEKFANIALVKAMAKLRVKVGGLYEAT